ncbi:SIMPL domain-containing protein [Paenibacillus agilis]|uniref:DUF541 domain-containing protein n=1 Tax=Paenibacillus agilis TaxID=3020863 RepID=A0A559IK55_9BACL|nr:SIMPL domain-containing protein [Paenibacillus agilis]TVX88038.1 DUF541 domain-containing protein [Paenibacillus agilis]
MHQLWKRTMVAVALCAALFVTSVQLQPGTASAAVATDVNRNVISVTGQGKLEVDPDIAYVVLGVVTKADKADEAQKLNAEKFDKVKKALTSHGVDNKDVKTVQFSVQPQYSYKENQEPKIVGYEARHQVKVSYRKLSQLGDLVDVVSKAGANDISDISFGIENIESLELQALEKAVANGTKKAQALAKASGRQLGQVLTISETGSDFSIPRLAVAEMANDQMAKVAPSAPQAGQVKIQVNVQLQFELK